MAIDPGRGASVDAARPASCRPTSDFPKTFRTARPIAI